MQFDNKITEFNNLILIFLQIMKVKNFEYLLKYKNIGYQGNR